VLAGLTATIADRFTEMFRRHVWQPFADEGTPAAKVIEITGSLRQLGPLAQAVLDSSFALALQASGQRFLDEQAGVLSGGSAVPASPAPKRAAKHAKKRAKKHAAPPEPKPAAPRATKAVAKKRSAPTGSTTKAPGATRAKRR